jgi:hypothetical protein
MIRSIKALNVSKSVHNTLDVSLYFTNNDIYKTKIYQFLCLVDCWGSKGNKNEDLFCIPTVIY